MKLHIQNSITFKVVLLLSTCSCLLFFQSCNMSPLATKPDPGLATRAAYHIGSAVDMPWLTSDSAMIKVLKDNFNSITPENCLKPALLHPEKDYYNWKDGIYMAEFCKRNNFRLHGHTLIWHRQVPDWMKNFEGDSAAFEAIFKEHIQTIVTRFNDYTTSWDVVNEAIADNTGEWRVTLWRERLGDDYIARAFRYAREAAPLVKLFYNDYALESDTLKRNRALKMAADFSARKVPLDGIGLQMHIGIDKPSLKEIEETLVRFAGTGLLIHISELDIRFNEPNKKTLYQQFTSAMADRQKLRYEEVVGAYNRLIPKHQQYGITVWGFADKYNWIRTSHKQPDWPVLYDDSLRKKPAWYGFANALEQK